MQMMTISQVDCRASLEYLKVAGASPNILHVHEWQTSALPMLYWEAYHSAGLSQPRIVLTIHCLDNAGECREDDFAYTGAATGSLTWHLV